MGFLNKWITFCFISVFLILNLTFRSASAAKVCNICEEVAIRCGEDEVVAGVLLGGRYDQQRDKFSCSDRASYNVSIISCSADCGDTFLKHGCMWNEDSNNCTFDLENTKDLKCPTCLDGRKLECVPAVRVHRLTNGSNEAIQVSSLDFTGYIMTPDYPKDYQPGSASSITVSSRHGLGIQLEVVDIELNPPIDDEICTDADHLLIEISERYPATGQGQGPSVLMPLLTEQLTKQSTSVYCGTNKSPIRPISTASLSYFEINVTFVRKKTHFQNHRGALLRLTAFVAKSTATTCPNCLFGTMNSSTSSPEITNIMTTIAVSVTVTALVVASVTVSLIVVFRRRAALRRRRPTIASKPSQSSIRAYQKDTELLVSANYM